MKMKMKKMRSKSFPVSSWRRECLEPYQCRNPIENFEEEEVERTGSLKRHYLLLHDSDYCLVCGILDKCVSCSGIDCLLSFHQEELEEDIGNLYCPYCWFNILSCLRRDKAVVVGGENAHLKYLYLEMICRDGVKESVPKSQGDNVYSVDTTEIVSDQELQGDKDDDDACSSKLLLLDNVSDKSNMPLVEETDQEYTSLSGGDDDDNVYSVDTTEIVTDQELQGDEGDDACSSKLLLLDNDSDKSNMSLVEETDQEYTSLSGGDDDDDNVYSVGTTEIVTDQELQGDEGDDACSSKWEQVQIDEDSDQSNMPLVEETDTEEEYYTGKLQVRDKVEASDDETAQDQTRVNTGVENGYSTDIVSDQELQGDTDSDQSNMPFRKETDPEEYDTKTLQVIDEVEASQDEERVATENCRNDEDDETSQEQTRAGEKGDGSGKENDQFQPNENRRRRIVLKAIDSEISSSESSNKPIGEDVTEQINIVAKSKTVRDMTADFEYTSLSSVDDNGYSLDIIEIISDQELQGDKDDDACSSKGEQVQVDKDSGQSNMTLVEETDTEEHYTRTLQVIDEVEALDDETTQDENDQVQPNENRRQRRRRIRSRIALIAIDSEVSSNESTNKPIGEDVTKQITEVAKSKTVRDFSFFSNKDQRRRILWTSEEKEMLKVGVEKFAPEAKMNMPWRKILEMGKNVFHETRTSASLKDKWKNMIRGR